MKTLLLVVLWAIVIVSSVLVIGALAYQTPYLGLMTFLLTPNVVFFACLGAVLTFIAAILWSSKATTPRTVLLALSALVFLGSSFIIYCMADTFKREGITIAWLPTVVPAGGSSATPDVDVVYGTFEGQNLSLSIYLPPKATAPAPVLFYVHGGGWIMGDRNAANADMRWFAQQGFVVVTASYTLSTAEQHLWNTVHGQLGCAMAWVGQNIADHGGDPSRIGVVGESAGGNLALNLSYMSASGQLVSSCGGTIPEMKVAAVTYPALDLISFHNNKDAALGAWSRDMVSQYTGGSPEAVPAAYAAVNSVTYINPNAPPTLMMVGEADHLVPPEGAYRFAAKAQEAGVEVRLVRVPYGDHGFNSQPGSMGHQAYRQMTVNWFVNHGLAR